MSSSSSSSSAIIKTTKLQSVNRLLQQKADRQCPAESSSGDGSSPSSFFISAITTTALARGKEEREKGNCEQQQQNKRQDYQENKNDDGDAGIFVRADQDLSEGTNILSWKSEGFVLDNPQHRRTYCSYCCRRYNCGSSSLKFCPDCKDFNGNAMIGYCSSCTERHKLYHVENTDECQVLQCLYASKTYDRTLTSDDYTNQIIMEIFDSSIALLTIRLLSRRRRKINRIDEDDDHFRGNGVKEDRDSSRWDDFQLIYEHPLLSGQYDAIVTALADAFDAVLKNANVINTTITRTDASMKQLVRSIFGKILGCSHAIVDPSLPLGRQTLGRSVYVGHSFYNHSCAPNAYLSTYVMSSCPASSCSSLTSLAPSLTARVHLIKPIQKGEEITLSYVPLSGLSTEERQQSLSQGYGFHCQCRACCGEDDGDDEGDSAKDKNDENLNRIVLPPSYDFKTFGSTKIDSIREIQYGLNDQLLKVRRKTNDAKKEEEDDDNEQIKDELDGILGMNGMTERGIKNQNLPECHEVSIESDRLSAAAYDELLLLMIPCEEDNEEIHKTSKRRHREFFRKTSRIRNLFDPVALGTQYLACSSSIIRRNRWYKKNKNDDNGSKRVETKIKSGDSNEGDNDSGVEGGADFERERGVKILAACLGRDHPWVRSLLLEAPVEDKSRRRCSDTDSNGTLNNMKRQRLTQGLKDR